MAALTIPARFCGPPGVANGGYVGGLLAGRLGGRAEVTLRRPVPVDEELGVVDADGAVALVGPGEEVLAEAAPTGPVAPEDVPAPVDPATARAGAERSPVFGYHPFPGCFVCGPDRAPGDGLRVFPGAVGERRAFAAPWRPADAGVPGGAPVPDELVWGVLDCTGGIGGLNRDRDQTGGTWVLGRIAAEVTGTVVADAEHVAMGWALGAEGRKLAVGSAVFTATGRRVATSLATWIRLP